METSHDINLSALSKLTNVEAKAFVFRYTPRKFENGVFIQTKIASNPSTLPLKKSENTTINLPAAEKLECTL